MSTYFYFDTVRLNRSTGGVLNVSAVLLRHMRNSSTDTVRSVSERFPVLYSLFEWLRFSRFILDTLIYNYDVLRSMWSGVQPISIFPNYFLPFSFFRNHENSIVVVHDLQYKYFPSHFGLRKVLWLDWNLRRIARSEARVVFISQTSQDDFFRHFEKCPHPTVILNPVDAFVETQSDASHRKQERYLIAAYHYYPHKNFAGVLRLFARMRERGLVDSLYVTGNGSDKVERLISEQAPELRAHISLLGLVERHVLVDLYKGSVAFVSLSSFEGFNLSAAEAATLGVPLLLSNIAVHQELFSGYGCMVDGSDFEDIQSIEEYLATHRQLHPHWRHSARCEPAAVAASYLTLKI